MMADSGAKEGNWFFRKRKRVHITTENNVKDVYTCKLTPAERARRYREKKKNDPVFLEKERKRKKLARKKRTQEQIEKDQMRCRINQKRYRERLKEKGVKCSKKKKGHVLTRKESIKKREYWRIKQRESRQRRSAQKNRRVREKDRKYRNEKREKKKLEVKLRFEASRRENQRRTEKKRINESLLKTLRENHKIRKELTRKLANQEKCRKRAVSTFLGISSSYVSKISNSEVLEGRKKRNDKTHTGKIEQITNFFHRADVATTLPDRKRVQKNLMERKVLDSTLQTTYKEYHQSVEEPVSFSTFSKYKPQNIETTRKRKWNSCLCEACTNVELKIQALNNLAVKVRSEIKLKDKYDAVNKTLCLKEGKWNKKECVERNCNNCSTDLIIQYFQSLMNKSLNESITYTKWSSIKLRRNEKEVTQIMPISQQKSPTGVLIELAGELHSLAKHLFVAKWQQDQFSNITSTLPKNWVVLVMDFSENYSCVMQNEVQSAHWGHTQITLHPIVAFYSCQECQETVQEALIFVTDDLRHDAHAVNEFITLSNKHLQEERGLVIEREIQFSDGCAAQYKSKVPFTDLSYAYDDFGFWIERHFYGSRHGKGPSDGAGAVVKSSIRRGVLGMKVLINSATDLFAFGQKSLETIDQKDQHVHHKRKFFLVEHIDRDRPERTSGKTLVGTRKLQCIKPAGEDLQGIVCIRNLSCFCPACNTGEGTCLNKDHVNDWDTKSLNSTSRRRVGRQQNRGIAGTRGRGTRGTGQRRGRGTRGTGQRRGRGTRGTGRCRRGNVAEDAAAIGQRGVRTRGRKGKRRGVTSNGHRGVRTRGGGRVRTRGGRQGQQEAENQIDTIDFLNSSDSDMSETFTLPNPEIFSSSEEEESLEISGLSGIIQSLDEEWPQLFEAELEVEQVMPETTVDTGNGVDILTLMNPSQCEVILGGTSSTDAQVFLLSTVDSQLPVIGAAQEDGQPPVTVTVLADQQESGSGIPPADVQTRAMVTTKTNVQLHEIGKMPAGDQPPVSGITTVDDQPHVIGITPADDQPPVSGTTPADDQSPVSRTTADDQPHAIYTIPADDQSPVCDTTTADDQPPVSGTTAVDDQPPVSDATTADGQPHIIGTTLADDQSPACGTNTVDDQQHLIGITPADDQPPVSGTTQADDQSPVSRTTVDDQPHAICTIPADDQSPVCDTTTADDQPPVSGTTAVDDQPPVSDATTADGQPHVIGTTSAVSGTTTADESHVIGTTPVDDQSPVSGTTRADNQPHVIGTVTADVQPCVFGTTPADDQPHVIGTIPPVSGATIADDQKPIHCLETDEKKKYNTGDHLLINCGSSLLPAVVECWPYVKFYSTVKCKKESWMISDVKHTIIDSDVIRIISTPDCLVRGTRIYYKFKEQDLYG